MLLALYNFIVQLLCVYKIDAKALYLYLYTRLYAILLYRGITFFFIISPTLRNKRTKSKRKEH